MLEHLWHDIGNTKVEIVSFLSHEEGEAMYTQAIESMNGNLDELKDKFWPAFFPMSCIILYQGQSLTLNSMRRSL